MPQTLDRRRFIRVAALSGAATGAAMLGLTKAADVAAAGPDGDAAVGTILSAGEHELVIEAGDRRLSVVPTTAAQMYSGAFGEVTGPASFIVGDRVAVSGTRHGNRMEATFIGSIYSRVAATVQEISRDRTVARTNIGDIELEAGRLPFTSRSNQATLRNLREVAEGTTITGLVWVHPQTDEMFLLIGG